MKNIINEALIRVEKLVPSDIPEEYNNYYVIYNKYYIIKILAGSFPKRLQVISKTVADRTQLSNHIGHPCYVKIHEDNINVIGWAENILSAIPIAEKLGSPKFI